MLLFVFPGGILGGLDQAEILALPGDSHNLDHGPAGSIQPEAFADGALVGIVFVREELVDNGDARRIRPVGHGKRAAVHDGDIDRREVVFAHNSGKNADRFNAGRQLDAFGNNPFLRSRRDHGHGFGESCILYAGESSR